MFFKKKPDTVESLTDKCMDKMGEFLGHLTKAHYRSYYEFKCYLKDDFLFLMTEISKSKNEDTAMKLLQHYKQQLDFITKHPFSAEKKEFDEFLAKNYPYKEKVAEIIQATQPTSKFKL